MSDLKQRVGAAIKPSVDLSERRTVETTHIKALLAFDRCARRDGSRVHSRSMYLPAVFLISIESNMSRSRPSITSAAQTDLLCYLVACALASHSLTKTLRVEHVVESARVWLARNMMSASWLDRLMLGQLALKLSREHVAASHGMPQSDILTLFTNELTLNYESPLVGKIWQKCRDALEA